MAHHTEKAFDTITYEVTGHTATITLNRPEALNALTPHMVSELRAAYDEAEGDDDIWLMIVTANGRAFCTGADVKEIPDDGKVIYERPYLSTYDQWEAPQEGTPPFRRMAKPVLAAINGICCGAGLDWVTTGDIVIASDKATFFDPHVSIAAGPGGPPARCHRDRRDQPAPCPVGPGAAHQPPPAARDRRHREFQCPTGSSGHPAGHPQDAGSTAAGG